MLYKENLLTGLVSQMASAVRSEIQRPQISSETSCMGRNAIAGKLSRKKSTTSLSVVACCGCSPDARRESCSVTNGVRSAMEVGFKKWSRTHWDNVNNRACLGDVVTLTPIPRKRTSGFGGFVAMLMASPW